jgi:hypothetical protein
MGAWGPGIFSNDTAADAREAWRDLLIAGEDPRAASERIVARYGGDDEDTDFWTGLAAAQHETGHLQDDVRDRALAIIAAGGDLELWENADRRGRERALERLAQKLRGPQPAPKKLRGRRPGIDPGVELGDVVRLWSSDRRRCALFAVVAEQQLKRSRWPVLVGLYTEDDPHEVPPRNELARLPYLSAGEDVPLVQTVMVDRPGDELRQEIGEIVARGVAPPALPADYGDWADCGSFAALAYEVERIDRYREATRRRLDGRAAEDHREFERRSRLMQQFWAGQLRNTLEEMDAIELDDLSSREAAQMEELRDAATEMLADLEPEDEEQ